MPETTATSDKERPFDTYDARVEQSVALSPRVKGLRLCLLNGGKMVFKAGQFVRVFVPVGDSFQRASYSIASSPRRTDAIDLCVALAERGPSSRYLHSRRVGDQVRINGPFGQFTLPDAVTRDSVFVATGSGIAPLRSMIQDLLDRKITRTIYLLFGNRFEDDILYRREWDELGVARGNFKAHFALSRGAPEGGGTRGYVQDCVQTFVPCPSEKEFYVCGVAKMIDAVREKLGGMGVPAEQIHFERYG